MERERERFAGHCFGCGEWGHFMAECHRHCPSTIKVPTEGNGKEGIRTDVGVSDIVVVMDDIVVVMDEGT